MPLIAVIAPNRELAELSRLLAGKDKSVTVMEARLEQGVKAACEAVEQGAQVLVSRGITCQMIAEALPEVSLVNITFSGYDVLRAYFNAASLSEKMAVVTERSVIEGFESIEEILGAAYPATIKIGIVNYRDYYGGVEKAVLQGARCIIGNQAVVSLAAEHKVAGVLLRSGKEAVSHGLDAARQMLARHKLRDSNIKQTETIINAINYGIMAIDGQGVITAINAEAKRLLLAAGAAGEAGKNTILEAMQTCMDQGETLMGKVVRLSDNMDVAVNYLPIYTNGEVIGLAATLQELRSLRDMERNTRRELARRGRVARYSFRDIASQAPEMQEIIREAEQFARYDDTVLILGETGVGKEYFAHAIHEASPRRHGPFIAVNCAAIPENILESELFGYVEGAFTGARRGGKTGLFEQAHGGSIFLDEIGEMSEALQARLLRVLQEHEIYRIGDDRVIPVDIRVIAATNRELPAMVEAGKFREDLYYRLDALTVEVPPLRSRTGDIPLLASKFIRDFNEKYHKAIEGFSQQGLEALMSYDWPGNIRELNNVIGRLIARAASPVISAGEVNRCLRKRESNATGSNLPGMKAAEALAIREALLKTKGNKQEAADLLGIGRATLWRKLKQMNNESS